MPENQKSERLGRLLRQRRHELGLGLNELARRAGVDPAGLARAEHSAKVPSPETLASLAGALGLPLADLYEAAGYPLPSQLPSIRPYLRHAYNVPDEAAAEIEDYLARIAARYGGPALPRDGEDEAPDNEQEPVIERR